MHRRRPASWCRKALWPLAFALAAIGISTSCDREEAPPNLLLYTIDTLRADALEPYGNDIVETPAISRLAREGIVYERAFAASSWTRPSVASMLTGLPPDRHGVHTRHDGLPRDVVRLPDVLREAGYRTGAIITNPNAGSYFGFADGFDDFVELFEAIEDDHVAHDYPRARSDAVTDRAIEWIGSGPEPWFLFILTTDPHTPYEPPPEFERYKGKGRFGPRPEGISRVAHWAAQVKKRKYWGEVTANDASFGRLIDHMETSGSLDRSAVLVVSDHGEHFREHGEMAHGKTLYQEVLHIPMILRLPGGEGGGERIASPVQSIDVFPTLLRLAGVGSEAPHTAGASEAAPLPRRERARDREVYSHLDLDGLHGEMIYRAPWKLIRPTPSPRGKRGLGPLLVDLEADPREQSDLRDAQPDLLAELEAALDRRTETAAPRPPAPQRTELPEDVRRSLEHLGYIEGEH